MNKVRPDKISAITVVDDDHGDDGDDEDNDYMDDDDFSDDTVTRGDKDKEADPCSSSESFPPLL